MNFWYHGFVSFVRWSPHPSPKHFAVLVISFPSYYCLHYKFTYSMNVPSFAYWIFPNFSFSGSSFTNPPYVVIGFFLFFPPKFGLLRYNLYTVKFIPFSLQLYEIWQTQIVINPSPQLRYRIVPSSQKDCSCHLVVTPSTVLSMVLVFLFSDWLVSL